MDCENKLIEDQTRRHRQSWMPPTLVGGGFVSGTINESRLVQQARTLCAGDVGSEPRQVIAQTKASDPSRANHRDERWREGRVDCDWHELVTSEGAWPSKIHEEWKGGEGVKRGGPILE